MPAPIVQGRASISKCRTAAPGRAGQWWRGSWRGSVPSTAAWKGAAPHLGLSWHCRLRQGSGSFAGVNYLLAVRWVLLAARLGYQHDLEWPLVCSCDGGCCGACQADGALRAGEKLLRSGRPGKMQPTAGSWLDTRAGAARPQSTPQREAPVVRAVPT